MNQCSSIPHLIYVHWGRWMDIKNFQSLHTFFSTKDNSYIYDCRQHETRFWICPADKYLKEQTSPNQRGSRPKSRGVFCPSFLFSGSFLGNWSSVLELIDAFILKTEGSEWLMWERSGTDKICLWLLQRTTVFAGKIVCRNQLVGLN